MAMSTAKTNYMCTCYACSLVYMCTLTAATYALIKVPSICVCTCKYYTNVNTHCMFCMIWIGEHIRGVHSHIDYKVCVVNRFRYGH